MDLAVFYQIVVPLLEMGESILIMISTPVDSFNFYSELINLKDPSTGEHVFSVYEMDLICKLCLQTEHPEQCKHNLKYIPPWKSAERLEMVKLILRDNKTILKRESMGVVTDNGETLIHKKDIERLFSSEARRKLDAFHTPRQILVACDPNTSSEDGSSEMSLVSIVCIENQVWVVGLDSHSCGNPEQCESLLYNHLHGLRSHPYLADAVIVFIGERNTGHEVGYLARVVQRFKNTVCVEQKPNEVGIWTDTQMKLSYAFAMRYTVNSWGIFLMEDLVCRNPYLEEEDRREKTLAKLEDQLRRYKLHPLKSKSPVGRQQVAVSGKVDKEGKVSSNFQDDLATGLGMALGFWQKVLVREFDWIPYAKIFPDRGR